LGESEEQDDFLREEGGTEEEKEQAAKRKKRLAELFDELDLLEIPVSQAALTIGRNATALRNLKLNDAIPTQKLIDLLEEYVLIQYRLREHFRKRSKNEVSNQFSVNESPGEYITLQREILAEVKQGNAYNKAYIKREIEKEVNGDRQLANEILESFEQAIEADQTNPNQPKPVKGTKYFSIKGKPKEKDTDQSTTPEEPAQ
jgi:CYTH domain-containing protein